MKFLYNNSAFTNHRKVLRNESTPQEMLLWNQLRSSKLGYKFRRQASIGNYIVDFYCPEKRVVIELDGSQHIENKKDILRDQVLKSLDCKVLRFWNNEINNNMEGVVLLIQKTLNEE
jgi:very-short-patch-repair endonuclease